MLNKFFSGKKRERKALTLDKGDIVTKTQIDLKKLGKNLCKAVSLTSLITALNTNISYKLCKK